MKKAFLQIHLAVLLWGFTGVLGRAISVGPMVLVWYRMLITALIIGIIISYRREWVKIDKEDRGRILGIGIMYAIHWVAFYAAIKFANASIGMVCLATSSLFTAILDPLMKRRSINRIELLLSLIAMGGVACIYILQDDAKGEPMRKFELGIVLAVAAAIISAIFTVLNKPLAGKYQPRNLVFYEMSAGFLFLSLLAPFFLMLEPDAELLPQGLDYLWIFLLSYCCTVWGQNLAMSALKKLSPFTITLSVNVEPIYGVLLAFLIYQENKQLGLGFYLGMTLIFISLALQVGTVMRRSRRVKQVRKLRA
jgi:drug/metabolite transporter (DMT)-like permease